MTNQRDLHLCQAIQRAVRDDARQGRVRPIRYYIRQVLQHTQPAFYYVEPEQAFRMMRLIDSHPAQFSRRGRGSREQWVEIYTRLKARLEAKGVTDPRQWRRHLHMVLLTRPSRYFISYDRARRVYQRYLQAQ